MFKEDVYSFSWRNDLNKKRYSTKKSVEWENIAGCIEEFWRLAIENNPRIFDCAAGGNRRIVNTKN